jgi:hypothetical protein
MKEFVNFLGASTIDDPIKLSFKKGWLGIKLAPCTA